MRARLRIRPARYLDGKPDNLPAAAWDALEWLQVLRCKPDWPRSEEDRARLRGAITALEACLTPYLPAEFYRTVEEEAEP